MRYQRTQIYLQPEAHRLLSEEAKNRGLSLTGLLREIVTLHVRERVSAYRPRGFDALIGVAGDGARTDVAREGPKYLDEAMELRLRKKLGGPRTGIGRKAQVKPRPPRRSA